MTMNVLKARDVALLPAQHTASEQEDARRALILSAERNKDRARAAADMRLAASLRSHIAATIEVTKAG